MGEEESKNQNSTSEVTSGLHAIRQFDSQELLTPESIEQFGLTELIMQGYEFTGDEAYATEQLHIEYGQKPGGKSITFLALSAEGKAIGSLTYSELERENKDAQVFFGVLEEQFPAVAAHIAEDNSPILYTRGIVVSPNAQTQGIAKRLIQDAIGLLHPSVILGETRTPGAVAVRNAISGYETSYCDTNLVGEGMALTEEQRALRQAMLAALPHLQDHYLEEDQEYAEQGVVHVDTDYLPPIVQYPNQNNPLLVRSSGPVVKAQERLNQEGIEKTAVGLLISVRASANQ